MSEEETQAEAKVESRSRQAWSQFGDAFGDIGRQFHQDYEHVTEAASEGTEKSQQSIERAVKAILTAIEDTGRTIGESLRDPNVRKETEEAGAALLRAVGVSLSALGETLQADAERERHGNRAA
jgi:hypothetical protein